MGQQILSEKIDRPKVLHGNAYTIDAPEHSLFNITINNIVLNQGTEHEIEQPFEVIINTDEVMFVAWATALSKILTAVLRKGGDIMFLVDELQATFDPRGGYFARKKLQPSILAEIGDILAKHIETLSSNNAK